MIKTESLLMQLAKKNVTLSNDTCKRIIKNSKLIDSGMSIGEFKAAYQSTKTPAVYRAMLLASAYDKNVNFLHTFKELSTNPAFQQSNIRLHTKNVDGKPAFSLSYVKWKKSDIRLVNVPLNSKLREEVYKWKPKGEKNILLTRALMTPNVHAQKTAFFLGDLKTAIYAAADMIITNVKANDPFLIYLIDSDKPPIDELIAALGDEVGVFTHKQSRFLKDLLHVKGEFDKFAPVLKRLGLDVTNVFKELNILISDMEAFVSGQYRDSVDEAWALYDGFENVNPTISALQELALAVDDLDITDPALYKIGRLEILPSFVDYSPKKAGKHRRAVDGSVQEFIATQLITTSFNTNV